MGAIMSHITSLTIVYSAVYSGADQRKHQSSASLAFVWGIHRGPVNSRHKWPVTRKIFPFDDVIMKSHNAKIIYMSAVSALLTICAWKPLVVFIRRPREHHWLSWFLTVTQNNSSYWVEQTVLWPNCDDLFDIRRRTKVVIREVNLFEIYCRVLCLWKSGPPKNKSVHRATDLQVILELGLFNGCHVHGMLQYFVFALSITVTP